MAEEEEIEDNLLVQQPRIRPATEEAEKAAGTLTLLLRRR
jgi:hypothetical protein